MPDSITQTLHDPDGLKIRPVMRGDCDGLMALLNAGAKSLSQQQLISQKLPDAIRRKLEGEDPNVFRLVALLKGKIIGHAALQLKLQTGTLTISVREDLRGRGIGNALLGGLLEAANQQLGLTRVDVDVLCDNQPAINLYRRFGFEVEARRNDGDGPEILTMVRAPF